MKRIINSIILLTVLATTISSCQKDDNSMSSSIAALNTAAQQGKWKVTFYNENGVDETSHYIGYEFQFSSNGTVLVTKNATNVNGTWSAGSDDSHLKLVLNFGTANPFQELNDDWHVTEQSASIIKLQDVSGGNGGTDYLTFEKI
jgi:hypothetical protein